MTTPQPMTADEIAAIVKRHTFAPSHSPETCHRNLWRAHGGRQHGPHIETYTIPESAFGAPGDYDYDTPRGDALFALYRAQYSLNGGRADG